MAFDYIVQNLTCSECKEYSVILMVSKNILEIDVSSMYSRLLMIMHGNKLIGFSYFLELFVFLRKHEVSRIFSLNKASIKLFLHF